VGQSLIELVEDEKRLLNSLGLEISIVSVSDSNGTCIDEKGLNPSEILKYKRLEWKNFRKFEKGRSVLDSIKHVDSDLVVEMTPSTPNGEPGLSNIKAALAAKKHVVTSNKGPLVVAFNDLMRATRKNGVRLLYEATVAAHVPVFCLVESCFKADELEGVRGILNATTNFMIGEIERGGDFQKALSEAKRAGWVEANYSDDVDGIDAARKLVIVANALFRKNVKLGEVSITGIRHIEPIIREAKRTNKKVKLICEISRHRDKLDLKVGPKVVPRKDPLSNVNEGDMGIEFNWKISKKVFVSAHFQGPKQVAYAVLNDILRTNSSGTSCC